MSSFNTFGPWATAARLAAVLAIPAALAAYLAYLTPEKRLVRHHLGVADAKSQAAIDGRFRPVRDLFAAGRKGAPGFAREVLSLNGKWNLVRGVVAPGDYKEFLSDAFARHVLAPDDLKAAIEGACAAYLSDQDAIESEMLVGLRADLADRPAERLPPHLQSREAFAREYKALAARVASQTGADLAVVGGREAVMLVVTEITTRAAVQAAQAAAAEMGVHTAVLSSGTASFVATVGVGFLISLVVDYVLDAVLKLAGYDPEAKVAAAVVDSLDRMEAALLRDAGLRRRVGLGEHGSLRVEMERLHESHSRRRRDAVGLVLSEGGNP